MPVSARNKCLEAILRNGIADSALLLTHRNVEFYKNHITDRSYTSEVNSSRPPASAATRPVVTTVKMPVPAAE